MCSSDLAMAPVVIVGDDYHGNAKPAQIGKYLAGQEGDDEN